MYISPNLYPEYGLEYDWGWVVKNTNYVNDLDITQVEVEFGYDGETHTETFDLDGQFEEYADAANAMIDQVDEFENSVLAPGPIHGGGFPPKK